jgi:Fic family protein
MGYIYQHNDWPNFYWKDEKLLHLLGTVRNLQGKVVGRMNALGFDLINQAVLETLTMDVVKSSEIEGEILDFQQVRSSIARRLGIDIAGLVQSDRNVDGIVDMMMDATGRYNQPLTKERLLGWHNSLFPSGYSGLYKVLVGKWRDDSTGPMQVVSGELGKEKVHFQAPKASELEAEMKRFLEWVNQNSELDLVLKAGLAHLWFVTLHPFDDGNGRVARAITDMILARSDGQPQRFYSMSTQIRNERKAYYEILEKTQKGSLDVTNWLNWFLHCLSRALQSSEIILQKVIIKHDFWKKNALLLENDRQKKMVNKLLDGIEGKLTTSKWAKMNKCSPDTALRDIQDLIDKGILIKSESGGRSTSYVIAK